MKTHRFMVFIFAALAGTGLMALGYVAGSSNLMFGCPSFSSTHNKPMKPYSKERYLVESYRMEVERYVNESKAYLEAANNDVGRIGEAKSEAIRDANQVINEYNDFIRYGY